MIHRMNRHDSVSIWYIIRSHWLYVEKLIYDRKFGIENWKSLLFNRGIKADKKLKISNATLVRLLPIKSAPLGGGYNYDSTAIRRLFDANSTRLLIKGH